jgi:DNA invertase Pin-like site-specific DNA recombinase
MLLGYARVSTDDQNLGLQRAALRAAGCRRLYEEKALGVKRDRPELARLLDQLRDDDVVVITRLDLLARSTRGLLSVVKQIQDAKAGLRSLAEPWADTTSPAGRTVLTVFAGIAEFERALIHQRTSAGRVAARQRGVRFGRTPKLGPEQLAFARKLVDAGRPVREVAGVLKCHRTTLYRALDALNRESGPTASNGYGMAL